MAKHEVSDNRFHQFKKDIVKLMVYMGVGGYLFIAPAFTVRYHLEYYRSYQDWSEEKFLYLFEKADGKTISFWTIHYHNDFLYVE